MSSTLLSQSETSPADIAEVNPPVLALTTLHASHAGRSGYPLLIEYLQNAELVSALRTNSNNFLTKNSIRLLRRVAFTRWYLSGCAELEWKAARRLWAGFEGVVHSLWGDHDLGFIDLLRRRRTQSLVATFHNCLDNLPQTLRFPRRLRGLDAAVLMSEVQRPFFLQAGVPASRLHVIPHGVDCEYFCPWAAKPDAPFTVLSVGGHRRNFPLLREVCQQMTAHREIQFRILAPADRRSLFADLPNVSFASGVTDEELLAAYRTASCLLLTLEDATANNALLESLACGLPVISERVGGIPEYVNEDCAVLTTPGSAAEIVNMLKQLQAEPAQRSAMGLAARAKAERFAWPLIAAQTEALYRTLR